MVRKIRAKVVLELQAQGLSGRAIAASQGMSRKSVTQVLEAASREQVVWKEIQEHSDDQVYDLLFPDRNEHVSVYEQPAQHCVHSALTGWPIEHLGCVKLLRQSLIGFSGF